MSQGYSNTNYSKSVALVAGVAFAYHSVRAILRALKAALAQAPIRAEDGFTLVELMMVVAISSLLASVAVPEFNKFAARARQGEAKAQLSAVYVGEQAFAAENLSYTLCLWQTGYAPEAGLKRYYTVGFWYPPDNMNCGPDQNTSCYVYSWNGPGVLCDGGAWVWGGSQRDDIVFDLNSAMNASMLLADLLPHPGWTVSKGSFTVGAFGSISTQPIWDVWTIDDQKNFNRVQSGI